MAKIAKILAFTMLIAIAIIGAYVYLVFSTATLQLKLTDPPVEWGEATEIHIHYSSIEIHRSEMSEKSGWIKVHDEGSIALSTVIDAEKVLSEVNLEPGVYDKIRFEILEAEITVNRVVSRASIPSGKLNIIITDGGVIMTGGQTSELLLDIQPKVVGSEKHGYTIIPNVKATP
jgi:hypothetical protein